jgi:hypothetical protein
MRVYNFTEKTVVEERLAHYTADSWEICILSETYDDCGHGFPCTRVVSLRVTSGRMSCESHGFVNRNVCKFPLIPRFWFSKAGFCRVSQAAPMQVKDYAPHGSVRLQIKNSAGAWKLQHQPAVEPILARP